MLLSVEQVQAIDNGEPVRVEIEGRECVLLSGDAYDHIRGLIEDWDLCTMQRHMARMMADDWNDPSMNVYDE